MADGVMPDTAAVTVAPELGLFLPARIRPGPVQVKCDGVSSLGHIVESIGVPLTEVGSLLVNGKPADPGYRPVGGDAVRVLAMARPQRVDCAQFVLDVHLGTVARWLRLAGVDAAYSRDADDDALIEQANAERRGLLTHDRGLLRRRQLWRGAHVPGARPGAHVAHALAPVAPPPPPAA